MAWGFSISVFSVNKFPIPMGPRYTPWNSFDLGRDFAEILANSMSLSTLCNAESENLVLRSIFLQIFLIRVSFCTNRPRPIFYRYLVFKVLWVFFENILPLLQSKSLSELWNMECGWPLSIFCTWKVPTFNVMNRGKWSKFDCFFFCFKHQKVLTFRDLNHINSKKFTDKINMKLLYFFNFTLENIEIKQLWNEF